MELSQVYEDGAIYLSYLMGEIGAYKLGPAFMQALVGVVLGSEGAEQLAMGKMSNEDLWMLMCATTAQRTKAAEQVLKQYGVEGEQDSL